MVFAHGSGNATRNLAFWNMYFVRLGMAVLSLDKRGAGQSTGDWHEADMDVIAGDWLAGVAMLKQRADIDGKRIGVHGSSQGGWTAPLMAARSKDIAFVIVRAGSGTNVLGHDGARDRLDRARCRRQRSGGAGSGSRRRAGCSISRRARRPWSEVSAFVASQKDKPSAQYVWPLNWSDGGWGFKWSGMNVGYDSTVPWRKVTVPVLWFLGELDHNVPTDVSEKRLLAVAKASGHAGLPGQAPGRAPATVSRSATPATTTNSTLPAISCRVTSTPWKAGCASASSSTDRGPRGARNGPADIIAGLLPRPRRPRHVRPRIRSLPLDRSLDGDYTLEHKYTRGEGRIYLSGVQALVRLPLMQQMRDRAAGMNTAGFISGYRGSPLGGFDLELWKAKKHLAASGDRIHAGPQRGPRRDHGLGHAAGQPVPGREVRRRVLHVVRQGPGRGPLRRRVQARQRRRHLEVRRRAGAGGRRPRLPLVDAAARLASWNSSAR